MGSCARILSLAETAKGIHGLKEGLVRGAWAAAESSHNSDPVANAFAVGVMFIVPGKEAPHQ